MRLRSGKSYSPAPSTPADGPQAASVPHTSTAAGPSSARRPRPASPGRPAPAASVSQAAELQAAIEDLRLDLDRSALVAALNVGAAHRKQAVASLVADGTVLPEHFFSDERTQDGHPVGLVDELLIYYEQPRRPDLSRFGEGPAAPARSPAETRIDEFDVLQALLQACVAPGAHPEIRQAMAARAEEHERTALELFLARAAWMERPVEAAAVEPFVRKAAPMLERLLSVPPGANPYAEGRDQIVNIVASALVMLTEATLGPQPAVTCHDYALRAIALHSTHPDRPKLASRMAQAIPHLPSERQHDAFLDSCRIIEESTRGSFHGADVLGSLQGLARVLPGLADEALGPSAEALVACADKTWRKEAGEEIARNIIEAGSAIDGRTGRTRFARLPEEDRLSLYLILLGQSDSGIGPAAIEFCERMLETMPAAARAEATGLLERARDGEVPDWTDPQTRFEGYYQNRGR